MKRKLLIVYLEEKRVTSSFITPSSMDRITEVLLQKSGIDINYRGMAERINIDEIIEFEYELEFDIINIDDLSKERNVMAALFPSEKKIYLNESKESLFKNIGLLNFTKAHELGHWVLHVTEQNEYEQLTFSKGERYFCRSNKKKPEEIQADMFAASLLMPRKVIIGAINDFKEKGYVTINDLYNLSEKLEVSVSALKNRISNLKLLYINDKEIYLSKDIAQGQLSLF